jgi:hypothetical protein
MLFYAFSSNSYSKTSKTGSKKGKLCFSEHNSSSLGRIALILGEKILAKDERC